MEAAAQNIKVLLIEDNPVDYNLTSKMFGVLKHEKPIQLEWSKSYEEGYRALESGRHDLYLIDYSLGNRTGLDLVEETCKKKLTDGPFVLLTDFEGKGLYERSAELGIYDHILKRELSPSVLNRTITYSMRRYKSEQDLKNEKEFSSFILSEIPYLVMSVDENGLISTVNPAVTNLLGCTQSQLLKRPWKDILHEEDRADIKYKVSESGEVLFEARLMSKVNEERMVNWNILNKGVSKDTQNTTAFILSGKDVTDQIKAEENERSRQKMEALGQLAGGVAHEMNNLLQPILMSSQMVASKYQKDPGALEGEYLLKNMARIERNAKSAAKIVDDILLFSRGDKKQTELLNVYDVVRHAVTFVRDMLPVTLSVKCDFEEMGELAVALINHNEMVQIITNMLINAAHAMGQSGEVFVKSKIENLTPERAANMKLQSGQFIKIDIIDTGYGISQENISKVFNPFFTTKDVGEGTGLGLSIVYKIIQEWSGTIKVESKIGRGTTFSIFIPVASASV